MENIVLGAPIICYYLTIDLFGSKYADYGMNSAIYHSKSWKWVFNRFWTDIWLDGGGLKGTFPSLYGPTTDNDCLVADAILNQGGRCDFKEILAIGKLGFLSVFKYLRTNNS